MPTRPTGNTSRTSNGDGGDDKGRIKFVALGMGTVMFGLGCLPIGTSGSAFELELTTNEPIGC